MKALALLCLVLVGCDEPSAAAPPRGHPGRGVASHADVPAPVAPSGPSRPRSGRADRSARAAPAPTRPAPEPIPTPPAAPDEAALSDALRRAFGTPTACIGEASRARLAGSFTVRVQVVVTSSGRVTRASVSGSQLAEEDLECLRRRAEALRIAVPVPDAPRSIAVSITYDVSSARVEASSPTPAGSRAPGRVAPDRTLPAAGTEGSRPPGFVPPSSTLPARAE